MHKQHAINYLGHREKRAAVRRRLLLQVATLAKERAARRCPAWPITAVVLVVEAGAGICRGVYFPEAGNGGDQTCAPSTLANKLWACVHTRI